MTEEITPEDQALFERVRAKPWQPIVDALGFEARGEPVPDDVTEAVNVAAMWLCASALVGAGADADDVARQFVERDYVIRLGYKRDAGDEAALDEFSFTIDWTDGGDPLTVELVVSAELDLLNEVVDRGRTLLNGGVVISPELFGRIQQAVTPTADPAMLVHICQRIRAGWLPRRLQAGSWWWGRPRAGGFDLWAQGLVPTMHMVEAMKPEEISAWTATLHPAAPELED